MTLFYLGTHMPHWLGKVNVPLVVSRRTLARYQTFPRATCRWGLDSGGFTELGGKRSTGRWEYPADAWARFARQLYDEVGGIDWVAPQDWMCEPSVRAKTGLTVAQHQRLTVDNYLELRSFDPDLPWMPVLQGWEPDDYRRCVDLYGRAGVDLSTEPLVGLGTVCRRQATREIGALVATLAEDRLRLHGFGVKMLGLKRYGWALSSADSASWSEFLPNQQPSLFGAVA